MLITLLPAALLAVAPSTIPASLGSDQKASQAYADLVQQYVDGNGLEMDLTFAMEGGNAARCRGTFVRPLAGSLELEIGGAVVKYVGDGKGIHVLNDAFKSYVTLPGGLMEVPVVGYLSPLQAWATGKARKPLSVKWIEFTPSNPLMRVLEVEFSDQHEKLWIGQNNALLACNIRVNKGPVEIEGHATFAKAEALNDVDPLDHLTPIPEGFTQLVNPEDKLLAVGTLAPDVELIDMDGETYKLSSLRGKTVLLNFWFYT